MFEFFIAWLIIASTNINSFFSGVGFWFTLIASCMTVGSFSAWAYSERVIEKTTINKILKAHVFVAFCGFIGSTIIPSKVDAAYIFGIGMGLKVMNNEQVAQIPENAARLINKYLEDAIKDEEIANKVPAQPTK